MCTSRDQRRDDERGPAGFTMIELVVALGLILCVCVAALLVWRTFEREAVTDADRMIRLLQGRVALARMERDLRLATAHGCTFKTTGPLLEAGRSVLVLLTRSNPAGDLVLVEWELVGGNLMRRRGPCPVSRPAVFTNALYVDHKTMIEGLAADGRFEYLSGGEQLAVPVPPGLLWRVDEVRLLARAVVDGRTTGEIPVVGGCLVGRR